MTIPRTIRTGARGTAFVVAVVIALGHPAAAEGFLADRAAGPSAQAEPKGRPDATGICEGPSVVPIPEGEGMPYDHNGSTVRVVPERGLVIYERSRAAASKAVRPGTVLFRGRPWDPHSPPGGDLRRLRIEGTAYLFRKGCAPASYRVVGGYHDEFGMFEMTLEGAAPVRLDGSCDVVGTTSTGGNARLSFSGAWE